MIYNDIKHNVMKFILTFLLAIMLSAVVSAQSVPTVTIGSQVWMAKNLNVGTMINSKLNQTNNKDASGNPIIEKYCYGNIPANCDVYGGLYQWDEMMQYSKVEGSQGICPDGFHVPTNAEWNVLFTTLGGIKIAGGALKETGTAHFKPINIDATNSSGFTALPTGLRWHNGSFYYQTYDGNYWTSTTAPYSPLNPYDVAYFGGVMYGSKTGTNGQFYKIEGLAVRCIKNK